MSVRTQIRTTPPFTIASRCEPTAEAFGVFAVAGRLVGAALRVVGAGFAAGVRLAGTGFRAAAGAGLAGACAQAEYEQKSSEHEISKNFFILSPFHEIFKNVPMVSKWQHFVVLGLKMQQLSESPEKPRRMDVEAQPSNLSKKLLQS